MPLSAETVTELAEILRADGISEAQIAELDLGSDESTEALINVLLDRGAFAGLEGLLPPSGEAPRTG